MIKELLIEELTKKRTKEAVKEIENDLNKIIREKNINLKLKLNIEWVV